MENEKSKKRVSPIVEVAGIRPQNNESTASVMAYQALIDATV